jgi:VWFA-related protein
MVFGGRLPRFGIVLLALAFPAAGMAQQKLPTPASPTNRITLDVVVTPKHGKAPVAGLAPGDFTVLDNGVPQKITTFSAMSGQAAQIEVVLVIDAVNTYHQAIAYERREIDRFLRANGGHLAHPTQLAVFTDKGTQIQNGFSTDGNALSKALDRFEVGMRSIPRSAGFYGAGERLALSIKALRMLTQREARYPGRKLILWISPGWPTFSGRAMRLSDSQRRGTFGTITDLSTELRKGRITIYSIDPLGLKDAGSAHMWAYEEFLDGVRSSNDAEYGDLALQVLAVQTGGQAFNSSNDVTAMLQKAVADTSAYYEFSFDPAEGEPDEYHKIEVKISRPGLTARTRTGYYSR